MTATSTQGYIYYSSDYGHTWTKSNSERFNWYSISISNSGQYALACINGGRIYYSIDFGHTWNLASSPSSNFSWTSISISGNGQYAIASISGSSIYRCTVTN